MAGVKNVVLVHGAWADGSCWSKVIPILIAKGLHAVAVQNPLSSVADDVASTNRLVDIQDGPVLLVGHSYGGAVITEAGNNPKVAGLVYVAAFAPEEGETLAGLAQGFPPPPLFKEIQPIADGYLMLTRTGVFDHFGQDLTTAEKELVLAAQGATQGAILATPIGKAAWHAKPSWFVIASNDHAIAPEQEASTAQRMGSKTLTLASSHLPMLSQPDKVAAFIIEAAGSFGEKAASA
jgi:pimeloyl-ACP methyl ester carboxylesterase